MFSGGSWIFQFGLISTTLLKSDKLSSLMKENILCIPVISVVLGEL